MSHSRLSLTVSLLYLFVTCSAAQAEEIRDLQVSDDDGRYRVSFDALLDAPITKTRPLLTEPHNWPRLSDIVSAAGVTSAGADGVQRVYVRFSACVLFFCKTVRKLEEMHTDANGDIITLALPEHSDFRYARERWRISGDDRHTRVQYEAELVPDFFVPPLIGPYLLKSRLRMLLTDTAENLEHLAR